MAAPASTSTAWMPGPEGPDLHGPDGWTLKRTDAGYAIVHPTEGPVAWAPFDEARQRAEALMAAVR